jgi:hypothetical protein
MSLSLRSSVRVLPFPRAAQDSSCQTATGDERAGEMRQEHPTKPTSKPIMPIPKFKITRMTRRAPFREP